MPQAPGTLAESPAPHAPAVVVPIPVEPSGPPAAQRDIAAITYAANPEKKGLDRVLAAWAAARREDEELVVDRDRRACRASPACARPARWSPRTTARCCAAPACS